MELFITDLQAYNEGFLVGKWITLPLSEFELSQAISEILTLGEFECDSAEHEEVFITDYESELLIGEYDSISKLNALAQQMQNFTDDDYLKLRVLSSEGYNERDVIEEGLDKYEVEIYDYRSNTSFTDTFELLAQDFIKDGLFGEIPSSLENYIDYEAIARDLRFDYTEVETNVIGRVS